MSITLNVTPPTNEPQILVAGDTWLWERTLDDYPATSGGWTLNYSLRGPGTIADIVATADDDSFLVQVPAATTAGYVAGIYAWQAYVTDGSGNRYTVDEGTLEVKANLQTAGATYDGRSTVKKILDAIEATLLGTASKEDAEIQIHGRTLRRRSLEELEKLHARYQHLYRIEQIRAGQLPPTAGIAVTFIGDGIHADR